MNRVFLPLACAVLTSSCSFYDYPSRTLVAREGEDVLGYTLVKVESGAVKIKGAPAKPIALKIGQRISAGNNQHLELLSTNPAHRQATFDHSWLEWHGGLSLPPF